MKCKICGYDILDGQTECPGCGTNVEELKKNNNVVMNVVPNVVEPSIPVDLSSSDVISPVDESLASEVEENVTMVETPTEEEVIVPTEVTPVEVAPVEPVVPVETVMPTEEVMTTETTPTEEVIAPVEMTSEEPVITTTQEENVTPVEMTTPVETVVESSPVNPEVMPQETNQTEVTPLERVNPVVETNDASVETVAPVAEANNTPVETVAPVVRENDEIIDEVVPTPEEEPHTDEPMASLDNDPKAVIPKKKGGALKIVLIVLLVIILLAAGVVAYFHFVFGSATNVYSRTIDTIGDKLMSSLKLDSNYKYLTANVGFTYKTTDDSNSNEFLNRLKINVNSQIDNTNNGNVTSVIAKYNDSTLELTSVAKDNKSYLLIKDVFDKYLDVTPAPSETTDYEIKQESDVIGSTETVDPTMDQSTNNDTVITVPNTTESTTESTDTIIGNDSSITPKVDVSGLSDITSLLDNSEELKRVMTVFGTAIKDSITTTDLTKTYTKVSVDGSEKLSSLVTYTLTSDEYLSLAKKVLTSVKGNDQAISDLMKITNQTSDEVKNSINKAMTDLKVDFTNIVFNVYTDLTTIQLYKMEVVETVGSDKNTISYTQKDSGFTLVEQGKNTNITIDTKAKTLSYLTTINGVTFGIDITNFEFKDVTSVVYPDALSEAVKEEELTAEDQQLITSKLFDNDVFKNTFSALNSMNTDNSTIEDMQ